MNKQTVLNAFPFDNPRQIADGKDQADVIVEIMEAYEQGYETVLLDAPTGVGKSCLISTVANLCDSAFYTTPQKSLRQQLENDSVLKDHYDVLSARADYQCGYPKKSVNCEECPVNNNSDMSCMEQSGCTYWNAKENAMNNHTAVLTFAYLIVDSYIPTYAQQAEGLKATQVSFGNRDLVAVDEGHSLEGQVASLFAGLTISWRTIPKDLLDRHEWYNFDYSWDTYDDVRELVKQLRRNAQRFIQQYDHIDEGKKAPQVKDCKNFVRKVDWIEREIHEGRHWVVDVENDFKDKKTGKMVRKLSLRPVLVDNFLQEHIWSRGEKKLIATATMPFRSQPSKWAERIGLNPNTTKMISVEMPFPKENRPIHRRYVGEMTGGGDEDLWKEILTEVNDIAGEHPGERGVVHCVSYSRGKNFERSSIAFKNLRKNIYLHSEDEGAEEAVEKWLSSDHDILVSPSCTEGVDLNDDKCRWGVMLKTPYMYAGDSRVSYLLNELYEWGWYKQEAMLDIIQAAGRGVRHDDDYCDFYIFDSKFDGLLKDVGVPEWFEEAIQ